VAATSTKSREASSSEAAGVVKPATQLRRPVRFSGRHERASSIGRYIVDFYCPEAIIRDRKFMTMSRVRWGRSCKPATVKRHRWPTTPAAP